MGQEIGNGMDWLEDEFEGRYQIVLTVDTGRRDTLLRLTDELDRFARELRGACGFRLDVNYVIHGRPRVNLGS